MRRHSVIDSPYGPLTLVAEDGVLCGLYMTDQRHRPAEETFGPLDASPFAQTEEELEAYFAGELRQFTIPAPEGHPLPAHRLEPPAHDPLRRDPHLRPTRRSPGQ